MIQLKELKVGQKLIFVKDCYNYGAGAIVEVASINLKNRDYPMRFHGISGYIWDESLAELKNARTSYPDGCFSIDQSEYDCLSYLDKDWDE
jgi:hypothetical protein